MPVKQVLMKREGFPQNRAKLLGNGDVPRKWKRDPLNEQHSAPALVLLRSAQPVGTPLT